MKKVLLFSIIGFFLFSGSAVAAEVSPIIKSADIDVALESGKVNVTEHFTISHAEAIKNGELEHILTTSENKTAKDLTITSSNKNLQFDKKEGKVLQKIQVKLPDGVKGQFDYEIKYHYVSEELTKIPLVIPAINAEGTGNGVTLKVDLPEGKYLHDSFPVIDSGDSGSVQERMMNVPNYLNLKVGSSPAGFFTTSNMYTIFGLVVIFGIIVAWLLNERKSKVGGVANV
ncbi:hypothetical protein M1K46_22490 [Fictibacillus sp. WQ 8-8]|uniref:hypothetical protein n=1 Tax=Fictibacillus sp. WQ 8-8 TaxID=2938788 RepID=UPI00210B2387|nr:hypothetical protein [Fictibacillus sp. WQ 8-8]MCQ6268359.1 hypothetical protein [Fictibacillus sp. WQ 8-8]